MHIPSTIFWNMRQETERWHSSYVMLVLATKLIFKFPFYDFHAPNMIYPYKKWRAKIQQSRVVVIVRYLMWHYNYMLHIPSGHTLNDDIMKHMPILYIILSCPHIWILISNFFLLHPINNDLNWFLYNYKRILIDNYCMYTVKKF